MKKHILITGGAGFIGSNFIRMLLHSDQHLNVTNLDCLSYSGNLDNLRALAGFSRYNFVEGNIRDRRLVHQLVEDCTAVVHFAAESHVDRSINDAMPFIKTNVEGTQVLLDVVREIQGRRFVHVSTDEVYGSLALDRPDLKFTEDSPLAPNSPYAASKAASDMLVRAYHHTHGLDVVTTRCSNNFGPFQFPEKVIPHFITKLLQGQNVPLYGDGQNVRDWIHVDDHCEGILTVLEHGKAGEVYNIGGNNERSNLQLTHLLLDAMGLGKDRIEYVDDRLGHDRRYAICSGKMRREFGWRPTRSSWPEALLQTVNWYLANEVWWRRILDGRYRQQSGTSSSFASNYAVA